MTHLTRVVLLVIVLVLPRDVFAQASTARAFGFGGILFSLDQRDHSGPVDVTSTHAWGTSLGAGWRIAGDFSVSVTIDLPVPASTALPQPSVVITDDQRNRVLSLLGGYEAHQGRSASITYLAGLGRVFHHRHFVFHGRGIETSETAEAYWAPEVGADVRWFYSKHAGLTSQVRLLVFNGTLGTLILRPSAGIAVKF